TVNRKQINAHWEDPATGRIHPTGHGHRVADAAQTRGLSPAGAVSSNAHYSCSNTSERSIGHVVQFLNSANFREIWELGKRNPLVRNETCHQKQPIRLVGQPLKIQTSK